MSSLAEEIRTRGYWWVRFQPSEYDPRRVGDYSSLIRIAEACSVRWTGWDFPHLANESPHRGEDYVGLDTDWEHYREIWRLYLSGQFVFLGGLPYDWRDRSGLWPPAGRWEPGEGLGIGEVINTLTEFFEFACRLSQTPAGADHLNVIVELHGLVGRRLYDDRANRDRMIFASPGQLSKWAFHRVVPRVELVSDAHDTAARAAMDLFHRFGWEMPLEAIKGHQERFVPASSD